MKNQYGLNRSILGLDIGTSSIGWALLETDGDRPSRLVATGVRIFEAGVEGDIESGRDESRAAKRRMARLHRRQLERTSRRLKKLALALQEHGLLPSGDVSTPEARKQFFDALDHTLSAGMADPAMLPFRLRARALDEQLLPHETGRAIYHLAQKRGFKSNRLTQEKENEEQNMIQKEVGELRAAMLKTGARTVGEHFAIIGKAGERIRGQHTFRDMKLDEFNAIWNAQRAHCPALFTEDAEKHINKAVFFQRHLKSNKGMIGRCDLERGRRAPKALLISQRFRMLQKVNDLRVISPDGEPRELTASERATLLQQLDTQGTMKFTAMRKKLGIKGKFNFEEGGDAELDGNKTAAKLAGVFGINAWNALTPAEQDKAVEQERSIRKHVTREQTAAKLAGVFGKDAWRALTPEQQDKAVEQVRSIRKRSAREQAAGQTWNMDPESAKKFADVTLEEGHIMLCQAAMAKLLPLMERGMSYATARKELYGAPPPPRAYDKLPPVHTSEMPDINNPAVRRALTELRKVVNAITAKYGKPDIIRIELARDIKRSRKARQELHKRNRANEKRRKDAAEALLKEAAGHWGDSWQPRRSDIDKWLLAEECGHICPYTGKPISFASLFVHPEFDIEHIIPFSRSLDNSFLNKTLCSAPENRSEKRKFTPWEIYGGTDQWNEIIGRVKKFRGDAAHSKLRRFQIKEVDKEIDDFASRELNDTRYISVLAVQYMGLLYGAGANGVDPSGKRRVQAARGQITAHLRDVLDLNSILGDGGAKNRDDHRHHAVDALCVALTDTRTVQQLSAAAASGENLGRSWYDTKLVTEPWPGFPDDARRAIHEITVSHSLNRKVNAAMHDETVYSKEHQDTEGRTCVHIRKPLVMLSDKMVKNIVDQTVRDKVMQALNGGAPGDVFKDPKNLPCFETSDGRRIPIKSVRIRVYQAVRAVGANASERNIVPGSNHHVEIFEIEDPKKGRKWDGRMVTTLDAMDRLRKKQPVVDKASNGNKFVFSLSQGDIISYQSNGESKLIRLRTLSMNKQGLIRIEGVHINDARKKADILKEKEWDILFLSSLQKSECIKIEISPLGDIHTAHD